MVQHAELFGGGEGVQGILDAGVCIFDGAVILGSIVYADYNTSHPFSYHHVMPSCCDYGRLVLLPSSVLSVGQHPVVSPTLSSVVAA